MRHKYLFKIFAIKNRVILYFVLSIFLQFSFITFSSSYAQDSAQVKVEGERGNWNLLVNGKNFYIKGAGCGAAVGKKGEDYLKLAKELGANCVRTWGIDQGTKEYLDKAASYGLMVIPGIWLNRVENNVSYIGENTYKKNKEAEVISYVNTFKAHPAILMWNVGNETIFFTKSEDEKVALCVFLESLVQKIHRIDPSHPVIYNSVNSLDLPYLKKYVPSLDIIGMNAYGSIRIFHSGWDLTGIDKPYVFTEFGQQLHFTRPKDINGKPEELGDYQKAFIYKDSMSQILGYKGYNLGALAFHLGETSQETMTWWNINEGNLKRQSYWALYALYNEIPAPFSAPKIKKLILNKVNDLEPGELIKVKVEMAEINQEPYMYEYVLSTAKEGIENYYVNAYIPTEVIGSGISVEVKAPLEEGIYRLYCFVKDNHGSVSSLNKTILVGKRNRNGI